MSRARDLDLDLKLRLKRLFFLQGYYTPLEVELSHYQEESRGLVRKSLTDLDVLGIKYDQLFTPHRVVCDCKSGKNVSDANRLFWLRGVSEFFGAHEAYFVRNTVDRHAKSLAPRMNLRFIDELELASIEKSLEVENLVLPLANPDFYDARRDLWEIQVPKGGTPTPDQLLKKHVYSYLSYNYWYVEMHRNLFSLINHFSKIAHLLRPLDAGDTLLAYTGLERFAHCMLEIGSFIYSAGLSRIQENLRLYLYGGITILRERQQFFDLIRQYTKTNAELDPEYLSDILELTHRMVHNSIGASKVLPLLEAVYGWCVQMGRSDVDTVFNGKTDLAAIVLAEDMCKVFCRSSGLNPDLFAHLLAL